MKENVNETRIHSSRMRTARSLPYRVEGALSRGVLSGRPPGRNMWTETETPRRNIGLETGTPWKEHGTRDRKEHWTRDRDLPGRNMGSEIETPPKEHGTRQPHKK